MNGSCFFYCEISVLSYFSFPFLQQFPSTLRKSALSETRLSEVKMPRPSSSPEEDSLTASDLALVQKSSKNPPKEMTRAVSSDVVCIRSRDWYAPV